MKNLNIDVARRHVQEIGETCPSSGTPLSLNTPDILNSLMTISNPFFDSPACPAPNSSIDPLTEQLTNDSSVSNNGDGETDKKVFATLETAPKPAKMSVPSLTTQFIKEGLKLTIQTKRKNCGKGELDIKSEIAPSTNKKRKEELTPEDEERRSRRRERNKVAATKCRNKKKEKTSILARESESLEGNNVSLKSEISKLKEEREKLLQVLAAHAPTCVLQNNMYGGNKATDMNIVHANGIQHF